MSRVRELTFDRNVVSLDTVKRAAYRLSDQFSSEFSADGKSIKTVLHFEPQKSDEAIDAVVDNFRKEVLDQDLRASIKAETEPVRNLILAHAFSRTALIHNE